MTKLDASPISHGDSALELRIGGDAYLFGLNDDGHETVCPVRIYRFAMARRNRTEPFQACAHVLLKERDATVLRTVPIDRLIAMPEECA